VRWLALIVVLAAVATAAPVRYEMAISVSPAGAISGEATVTVTAPADWPEAVFRLYPAALAADRLFLTRAWSDGEEVRWESIEPTTVTVALAATAGQMFSLTLCFSGQIPEFAHAGGYGSYAWSTRAVVLAQA